jgi:hypothetical protein
MGILPGRLQAHISALPDRTIGVLRARFLAAPRTLQRVLTLPG